MAWGRALTGVRFMRVDARELRDFVHGTMDVSRALREHFRHLGPGDSALAAMHDRRCVGLFAWRKSHRHATCLVARGTYVCREFRRCGLGRMLWQRALTQNAECEHVSVGVTTMAGRNLIESLASRNTDIVFRVHDRRTQLVHVLRAA